MRPDEVLSRLKKVLRKRSHSGAAQFFFLDNLKPIFFLQKIENKFFFIRQETFVKYGKCPISDTNTTTASTTTGQRK